MSAVLYVVGTPIGNLGDLSPRALQALEECDFIAAEDTRVTLKLLNHFDIKKPLVSYHEHNRYEMSPRIVERLLSGETCALVTDAGMPAISDPGEDLVRMCHEQGVKVESVPGPTAFATAMAISGMPSGRFTFEGFLSVNKVSRTEHIKSIAKEHRTMIFYEAPHKLAATLRDLAAALGDREIAIVREITKIHEQVIRTTLCEAACRYSQENLKGEIVLIIAGAPLEKEEDMTLEQAVESAHELMKDGCPPSEAARRAAKLSGFKKGDIYKLLQEEKDNA
ncbi:MAG: 16S rRNA (cytidine(1402)-2'-O)-methyltransferase [Clostridia bacterium]|nr:16S rRNA (cytidine(1402)-2'-O)-methyltransferase [Clostridia bacterium]